MGKVDPVFEGLIRRVKEKRPKFVRLSEQAESLPALREKEREHRQSIAEILGYLREDKSITNEEYHKLSTIVADLSFDEFFAVIGCFGACFLIDYQESETQFVGTLTIDLGGLLDDRPVHAKTND
jgi:hypothetical protein